MHLSCDGMVAGGSGMAGGGVTMAGPSLPRRNFQCNECFKRFKGRVELYIHAEACLMEALENEALAVLADLPPPHKFDRHGYEGPAADAAHSAMPATAGIVVKPRDVLAQRQERIEIRVGSGGVTATAGMGGTPSKRFKQELADEEGVEREQLPLADDPPPTLHQQHNAIMDLMCVYDAGPSSGERGMDTIEGPNGLRVMVTVEKADNLHHLEHHHHPHLLGAVLEGDDDEDDQRAHEGMALLEAEERMEERLPMGLMMEGEEEEEEVDGEEEQLMEEELLEMGEEGELLGGSAVHRPRPRVIGALANADDDSFKPKIECPTCGLVLYRHNFSTHYRIHTGELPFNCNYCERKFRTTSSLKVHLRAHTGEKPYACPNCDYATITKRNLDRHILNNHVRENRTTVRQRRSKYRNEDLPWPADSLYEEEGGEGGVGAGGDHQYQQETEEEEEEEESV